MKMTKNLEKCARTMKWYEFTIIKWDVVFGTLFLLTVWPGLRNVVLSVSWPWYLALMIVFMLPAIKKCYLK